MQILVVGSEKHVCNATECIIAVQGHFRVNEGRIRPPNIPVSPGQSRFTRDCPVYNRITFGMPKCPAFKIWYRLQQNVTKKLKMLLLFDIV